MFQVTVTGWFAAAHQLRFPDGQWERLHGHNWHVGVTYAGRALDSMGVLVDFVQVRRDLDLLLSQLHDTNLNELPVFAERNPSAEHVAVYIAERLVDAPGGELLAEVSVEEAPGCTARYQPPRRASSGA